MLKTLTSVAHRSYRLVTYSQHQRSLTARATTPPAAAAAAAAVAAAAGGGRSEAISRSSVTSGRAGARRRVSDSDVCEPSEKRPCHHSATSQSVASHFLVVSFISSNFYSTSCILNQQCCSTQCSASLPAQ